MVLEKGLSRGGGGRKASAESLGRLRKIGVDGSLLICARCCAPVLLPQEPLSPWRCCKVDFRREDERRPVEGPGVGDGCVSLRIKGAGVPASWYSWSKSSWISKLSGLGVAAGSKICASACKLAKVETLCKLLRLATGLAVLSGPKSMFASLRFSAPGGGLRLSGPEAANSLDHGVRRARNVKVQTVSRRLMRTAPRKRAGRY